MKSFITRSSALHFAATLALGLFAAASAGAATAPHPATATPVQAGAVADRGDGEGGGDGTMYARPWICQASSPDGGPLFYSRGCDLDQTMQEAIDTCERQMGGDCYQRGCTLDSQRDRECVQ